MDYGRLKLTGFKMENMVIDPAIVMVGRRGTGKSYVVRHILYHNRHIPCGMIISPTDKLDPFFKFFFPDIYIHYDINSDLFKKVLDRQMIIIEKSRDKIKQGKKLDPSSILIMDDCLSRKKSWAKDENIFEILMNGRHYRLTYILTMQTPLGICPELRLNFDYVFLLREDSAINRKKLWANYASIFTKLFYFEKALSTCTANNGCMVLDNRKSSENIKDKVFWFKAKKDISFTFGCEKFRKLHQKYYDPKYLVNKFKQHQNNVYEIKNMDFHVEKV